MLLAVEKSGTFIGKLPKGGDLLEELTKIAEENSIVLGKVTALGAVEEAKVAYYHQDRQEYEFFGLKGNLEILSLVGNISLRDGKPMVHAHAVFGDDKGMAFGGHLAPETKIFACEFIIEKFSGGELKRSYDEPTGLPLWAE